MDVNKETYVDHVIKRTVLSNSNKDRLMVSSAVDGRETVDTSRETIADIGAENTALGSIVKTLEERELGRVSRRRRVNRVNCLNDNVRVTCDVAGRVDLLRRSKVILIGVDEVTGLEVVNRHLDSEGGVGLDGAHVDGEDELGRWHVGRGSNDTHRRRVA